MPVVAALLLAIPVSVLSSRSRVGRAARRGGLFLTPPETAPDPVLVSFERHLATAGQAPAPTLRGIQAAIEDPAVNALHAALQGLSRGQRVSERIRAERQALADKVLAAGPAALSGAERRRLLRQPAVLLELHRRWWAQGCRPTG